MSLYQLKTQFQNQLRPISNTLVEQNITANQVTVSAVLLSIGTAYIIAKPAAEQQRLWLLLPSSLFVRMALNAIDGMMAREHGQASTLGAVLNEVGDMVADTALLVSLAPHILTPHINNKERQTVIANLPTNISISQYHITALIALSIGTELLGVTSNALLGVRANQGPLGKSDRAFILGVLGAFMGIRAKTPVGIKTQVALPAIKMGQLFILTEIMLLKTCLNRLRYMTELYLMRNPPKLRSVLGESTNNSLSLTVVLPNTSTDNARPLEFKEMPTTTVD
ncbi:CDP-alcohol phosphatidyltransferase family protein, partial [Psychrobacter sp.]